MAADKRAIQNGIINDKYQKLFVLKKGIFFGMTGIAEAGHEILDIIMNNTHLSATELIKLTDSTFQPNKITLTIMIAGKNEEGDFFIWQKNHEGDIRIADISVDTIAFSLSTNDNSELFNNHLKKELEAGKMIKEAILNTIKFASERDSSISKEFDMVEYINTQEIT